MNVHGIREHVATIINWSENDIETRIGKIKHYKTNFRKVVLHRRARVVSGCLTYRLEDVLSPAGWKLYYM